jgi:hypothetical protein
MPTASDELRQKMLEYFGDEIDDLPPQEFLTSHGFVLRKGYIYTHYYPWDVLTQKEKDCINFLCDEWDFGGYMSLKEYNEVRSEKEF